MERRLAALYALLGAVAAFALFAGLGDRLLWGDESETAYLARSVTHSGLPFAADGGNDITQFGRERWTNASGVWIWSPWLAVYVTAASFVAFGASTLAARLPFALAALLSVALLARLAYRVYRSHELALSATLLYVTCVPFLLHARQCRYYALVMLAQVWLLHGFHRVVEGKQLRGGSHLCGALAMQFYSNYVIVPANLAALLLSAFLLRRRFPGALRSVLLSGLAVAALAAPWLLYANPLAQTGQLGGGNPPAVIAGYYLRAIQFHVVPLAIFLLAPLAIRRQWREAARGGPAAAALALDLLLYTLVPAHLLVLSVWTRFFRYLVPLLPVLMLLTARIVAGSLRPRALRLAVIAVLAMSNVSSVVTGRWIDGERRLASPFARYLRSISTHYADRAEAVIRFLSESARPGETVYSPDTETSLAFYTRLELIDARLHTTLDVADLPDWILPRSATGVLDGPEIVPGPLIRQHYEQITLSVPDTPRGGARPDPELHEYFTAPTRESFVIYRKKREP